MKLIYFNEKICKRCSVLKVFAEKNKTNETNFHYLNCPFTRNLLEIEKFKDNFYGDDYGFKRTKLVEELSPEEIHHCIREKLIGNTNYAKVNKRIHFYKRLDADNFLVSRGFPVGGCPHFLDHLMFTENGGVGFRVGVIEDEKE